MSKLSEILKGGLLAGILGLLDKAIELVHSTLVAGGEYDDEFKQALATVYLWEPQLRKAVVASESTKVDDNLLDEIIQAGNRILPATLISEIKGIQAVEPVAEEPAEPEGGADPADPGGSG